MATYNIMINNEKAEIRMCDFSDIKNCQQLIVDNIEDKEIFEISNEQCFVQNRQCKEYIFGIFANNTFAAYFIIAIPGYDSSNLGLELDIPQDELLNVIHYDTIAILPEYRGNAIQEQVGKLIEREAESAGFKYICATVSPKNKYSLNNLTKLGYSIKKEKIMYGNKNRYIMYKELKNSK